jgi:hypothetical protein
MKEETRLSNWALNLRDHLKEFRPKEERIDHAAEEMSDLLQTASHTIKPSK